MEKKDKDKLDSVIESVVDTFKFHGVEITGMSLGKKDVPCFKVKVSKSKMTNSLDYTLNFVYWTLWSLIYGKYSDDKSRKFKISLDYVEVK